MTRKDTWRELLRFGFALFVAIFPALLGILFAFVSILYEKYIKKSAQI